MNHEYTIYFFSALASFLAIMNPFTKLPIFLGLVEGISDSQRLKVARTSVVVAFFILLFFILFGKAVFHVLHITIPGFKVAGGILLFYIGFEMLQSKRSDIHHENDEVEFDMEHAVSPLAIPILAGPGAIVTAMNQVSNHDFTHVSLLILAVGLICITTYLIFRYHALLTKIIGNYIMIVIGKIMGLLITIIGAGMVITGIKLGFGLMP